MGAVGRVVVGSGGLNWAVILVLILLAMFWLFALTVNAVHGTGETPRFRSPAPGTSVNWTRPKSRAGTREMGSTEEAQAARRRRRKIKSKGGTQAAEQGARWSTHWGDARSLAAFHVH